MNPKYYRMLSKFFITIMCVLSITLTALAAGPGEGFVDEGTNEGTSKVILCGSGEIVTEEAADTAEAIAAPISEVDTTAVLEPVAAGKQGASLGMFTTTGYCNCSKCSGGHNLTYSGTVPKAKHTISADLSKYPIGTKLMLNGIVYTVEDMGSSVKGNWIDVYYSSHQEALAHGMKKEEVFAVE